MENTQSSSRTYCIAVDGSIHSDYAFDLVLNELYQKRDKVIVVHIANQAKLSEIPFNFQPQTIISKYDAKLTGKLLRGDYQIIKEDRDKKSPHALLQVNQIALANSCSVLVLGFQGHKGKTQEELTKGVKFIINNIKLPTIVVKEKTERKKKDTEAFTWMMSIEQPNSRSFKAFQFATDYIDPSKDRILACHVKTYTDSHAKEVQEYFEEVCKKKGIQNYGVCVMEKESANSSNSSSSQIGKQLSDFVNFNSKEFVDFIIIGHNPEKYTSGFRFDNSSQSNAPSYTSPGEVIIKSASANILFYS